MSAGHEVTPRSCACRMVYWLGYVTAVVVMAAYSATLISFLTIQNKEPPFKTLEALVADRSYEMGLLRQYVRIIRHVRLQPCVLLLQNTGFREEYTTRTFFQTLQPDWRGADPGSGTVEGLLPLDCCNGGFESHQGHWCSWMFLSCVSCVLCRYRPLRLADHSSRVVVPSVACLSGTVKPRQWGTPGQLGAIAL